MKLSLDFNGAQVWVDTAAPLEISIPLDFHGDQPRSFGVPSASAAPLKTGDFIGDTRSGGSCNVECYSFITHCNGTHTECVGHITEARLSILDVLKDSFATACVVSVTPSPARSSAEHASVPFEKGDSLITAAALSAQLAKVTAPHSALIIRTLPNSRGKSVRDYGANPAAFLSLEAAQLIVEKGFRHILLDVPSLDRASDEGKLSAHRIFWGLIEGDKGQPRAEYLPKTITEFVFVPDSVKDASYLLQIEIAPFIADAAPSRVRLYRMRRENE